MLTQLPEFCISSKVILTFSSQLSVAVGLAAAGILSQDTVTSFGTPAITGASVSEEEMRCVSVVVLPQASVAVQVRRIVTPVAQPLSPLSVVSSKVTETLTSQLSVAVTFAVSGAGKVSPQTAILSAGTPINTGGSVSSMVII